MAEGIRPVPRSDVVGIVTVLYHCDEVIEDFFVCLGQQRGVALKLYVIDNNPTPATLERCRALAATHGIAAEFVFNDANVGVARGNNQGIELALRDGCRWVLLANNDTEFAPDTIFKLVQAGKAGHAVVTPKMLYHRPRGLIWYAGGRIDAWTMRTPHLGIGQTDAGQFDTPGATGYAPTCFLLVDAQVFAQVGVMDEQYFVYYDDTDFMWRLRCERVTVRYLPDAVVLHKVSTSTGGQVSAFSVYYANRNRIYFIRKHFRGMHKMVTLSYILMTRVPTALRLRGPVLARLWSGVRDGFGLPLRQHAD